MAVKTTWYKCEHEGDAQAYCEAIQAAGGTVIRTQHDADEEEVLILVDAENVDAVLDRLAKTETGQFCYQILARGEEALTT